MISILVPVYNAELHIEKCIRSILDQTFRDFELVLMDDGSKDTSGDICDRYSLIDSRVRVIHTPNRGVGAARNELVASARGEYIGFVDSDDYIEPDMFSVLYQNIITYEADISICSFDIVGKSKPRRGENKIETLSRKQAVCEIIDNRRVTHSVWDKLFKAELFEGIHFAQITAFEDMLTIYRLLEKCDKVVLDNRALYHYVPTPKSLMRSKFSAYHLAELDAQKELKENIGAVYPEMIPKLEISELKAKLIVYNRIYTESPEMDTLGKRILIELKSNCSKMVRSGDIDMKTKAMVIMIRICNPLYIICMRMIKGKI